MLLLLVLLDVVVVVGVVVVVRDCPELSYVLLSRTRHDFFCYKNHWESNFIAHRPGNINVTRHIPSKVCLGPPGIPHSMYQHLRHRLSGQTGLLVHLRFLLSAGGSARGASCANTPSPTTSPPAGGSPKGVSCSNTPSPTSQPPAGGSLKSAPWTNPILHDVAVPSGRVYDNWC